MQVAVALTAEQQRDTYKTLHSHLYLIFNAPSKNFVNYPFEWNDSECSVSITAIIEHFEETQQAALIKSCNSMLKKDFSRAVPAFLLKFLKADVLQREEGGIQFEANASTTPELLMEEIKISECASLWGHVKTYDEFLQLCQVRYNNKPFGSSSVRVVTFSAYHGTPIFIMLWLLRQLDYPKMSEACGFGQVIVTARNGLPSDGDEHNLHYSSGLIDWN
jgi:hypothetical protein